METGNGGDRVLRGNDCATVTGIENQVYIAMFGGGENDWWGNSLLYPTRPELQYLSQTEKLLKNIVLNSAGRLQIIEAVKQDLAFVKKYYAADVDVQVLLPGSNRCEIRISINGKNIVAVWNPATEFLTYQLAA